MRATSEGVRHPSSGAAAGLLAVLLAAGACGSMGDVGRSLNPWHEEAPPSAGAPPTPTAPEAETRTSPEGPELAPGEVLSEPLPPPPGQTAAVPGDETDGAARFGRSPLIELPTGDGRGRAGPGGRSIFLSPPPGVTRVTRVGLLLPLSGPHAEIGRSLLNAAELALFSVAGPEFALLPVDTGGTPEGAAAAAGRAIDGGARLILGPLFAASVRAAAPVALSRGIQVLAFSNDRTVAGNGVYVMGFAPETQIRRVLSYARDRGVQRLAAIVPEGPFGDRVEQTLRALTPYIGMELHAVLRHAGTTTDDLAPVVKHLARYDERRAALLARRRELEGQSGDAAKRALKRLESLDTLGDVDFDAVLLPQGGPTLRVLAPLLAFYDIDPRKVRMLGTVAWDDPVLATEPALIGGWFPAPPPAARGPFETAYAEAFGAEAPRIASLAYDATALAAVIARRAGPAGAPGPVASAEAAPIGEPMPGRVYSAEALTAANGFAGAGGIFRLLPTGLVERGLAVMEVRERRFEVVSPAPTTFERLGN